MTGPSRTARDNGPYLFQTASWQTGGVMDGVELACARPADRLKGGHYKQRGGPHIGDTRKNLRATPTAVGTVISTVPPVPAIWMARVSHTPDKVSDPSSR